MTRILLVAENGQNATRLISSLEENYLIEAILSQNFTNIIEEYTHEAPDLVLLEFNSRNITNEICKIREYDATACIVAMIDENNEDLIPLAYKTGVNSIIKYYQDFKTDNLTDTKNQINEISHIVQRNGKCLECWRKSKFVDIYHEQKTNELASIIK